jgi:hypothetical protein
MEEVRAYLGGQKKRKNKHHKSYIILNNSIRKPMNGET